MWFGKGSRKGYEELSSLFSRRATGDWVQPESLPAVADEVRNLANRTQDSVLQMQNMLGRNKQQV